MAFKRSYNELSWAEMDRTRSLKYLRIWPYDWCIYKKTAYFLLLILGIWLDIYLSTSLYSVHLILCPYNGSQITKIQHSLWNKLYFLTIILGTKLWWSDVKQAFKQTKNSELVVLPKYTILSSFEHKIKHVR